MDDYLDFLTKLDKVNIHTHYIKISLLSFDKENALYEVTGIAASGSVNVNTSSAIRRTINLTMFASDENSDIENINNQLSIDKKVRISVGLRNPLKKYIKKYGEIIWFPQGIYVISSLNVSRSTAGWNISLSGKDKMALLDGTAGGTLPATTVFSDKWVYREEDVIDIQYPTISQIIREAVHHWGGQPDEKIVISDLDEEAKLLVKYIGDEPIYFSSNHSSLSYVYHSQFFPNKVEYGQDAGYQYTDFTYPGELILNAGNTVVDLLNKIVSVLGNYEFFFDLDGNFVFQQIKNYLYQQSPLQELSAEDYVRDYNNQKFLYSLTSLDTTTQITKTPKIDSIKNDFYVWGQRKISSDVEIDICYHLAIDSKPIIQLADKYMWEIKQKGEDGIIVKYVFTQDNVPPRYDGLDVTLIANKCTDGEWREELYRRALNAQVTNSVYDNYYDSELLKNWRNLYNPGPLGENTWYIPDEDSNSKRKVNWNPDVFNDPSSIDYWLDFIDTTSELGPYSIAKIGRRTEVINNTDIKTIYNKEVPDIVFIESGRELTPEELDKITMGQDYFYLTPEYYNLFETSSTGASCFDEIREAIYQHLTYNTTITLTCLPKYYMEPNNIIHIEDRQMAINGNYLITQFTLPLTYNGTMSITATEVLTRV